MICTTLKANKENGISGIEMAIYIDECFVPVADLFKEEGNYYTDSCEDETDFDKLCNDFTDRQIASTCLKFLKKMAKDKEPIIPLLNYAPLKVFFELDCNGEIAFNQVKELIEKGKITGSNTIRDIDNKARKKGVTIRKGERYGENDIYFRYLYLDDLIEEYFPCNSEIGDGCNNCGNCH